MKTRIIAAVAALLATSAAPAHPPPQRVVSLNVCADPLLIALADPSQITALSPFAKEPGMAAPGSERFPVARGGAEALIILKPDLVLSSGPFHSPTLAMVERQGVRLVDVPYQYDLPSIEAAIRTVASAVGHPERGEQAVARLQARLQGLGAPPGRGRVAAQYQRRGFLTGAGSLEDDLMRRLGLVNLATKLGRGPLTTLSLDELALARPDFLIVGASSAWAQDQGAAMLRHPLLAKAFPPERRLTLPARFSECGGFGYAEALEDLARQIRAADASAAAQHRR